MSALQSQDKTMLLTNGLYLSPRGFERYDMMFFRHGLHFRDNGKIDFTFSNEPIDIESLWDKAPIASSTYSISGTILTFYIRRGSESQSHWTAKILPQSLFITIEQPDFEELPGLYTFTPAFHTDS